MHKPGTRVFESSLPIWVIQPRSAGAFGLAAISVGAAVLVRAALGYLDAHIPPFATCFVAILLTTIVAGSAAGGFATVLGIGLCWFMFASSLPAAFTPAAIIQ